MPGGQNICKVKLPHYMPSRHRGEADVQLHQYPTLALGGGGWSVPHPWLLCPQERGPVLIVQDSRLASGTVWKIIPHRGSRLLGP